MKNLFIKVINSFAITLIIIMLNFLFFNSLTFEVINLTIILCIEFFLIRKWFLSYLKLQEYLEKFDSFDNKNNSIEDIIKNDKFLKEIENYETKKNTSLNKTVLMNAKEKESKLFALQRQINPHFLYNTLETIRGQALIDDNEEIANMSEALACFFRYSISRNCDLVTLKEEFDNLKNYIRIQNYRFNDRFLVEYIIEEEDQTALKYYVPKLIIQPLVENAINHGLKDVTENAKIVVEVLLTDNNIIITISDNGIGINNKKLTEINSQLHTKDNQSPLETNNKNNGIALFNIQKRIQLIFGKEYGINVYSTVNYGTDIELILPIVKERLSFIE